MIVRKRFGSFFNARYSRLKRHKSVILLFVDGEEIRSFLSKDCTDSYEVADECFITNDDELNEVEYTCISTCEDDGCNIHIRE